MWQHALRFLDKYGVEVGEHWDELYEFADKTGILERHKQLLTRPGHSSEVRYSSYLDSDSVIFNIVHFIIMIIIREI